MEPSSDNLDRDISESSLDSDISESSLDSDISESSLNSDIPESSLDNLSVEFIITELIWNFAFDGCEDRVVEM